MKSKQCHKHRKTIIRKASFITFLSLFRSPPQIPSHNNKLFCSHAAPPSCFGSLFVLCIYNPVTVVHSTTARKHWQDGLVVILIQITVSFTNNRYIVWYNAWRFFSSNCVYSQCYCNGQVSCMSYYSFHYKICGLLESDRTMLCIAYLVMVIDESH